MSEMRDEAGVRINTDGWATAPSDLACGRAWNRIARIARDHCLIVQAYGGVMTLAIPEEQRKAGIRQTVLLAHQCKDGAS